MINGDGGTSRPSLACLLQLMPRHFLKFRWKYKTSSPG